MYIIGVTGSKTKGDTGPGLGNPNMTADKIMSPMRGILLNSFNGNKYPYENMRRVRWKYPNRGIARKMAGIANAVNSG
jgi:hypothetical protein